MTIALDNQGKLLRHPRTAQIQSQKVIILEKRKFKESNFMMTDL